LYRPAEAVALRWYPLLAFAHLAERRPDAQDNEPDPVREVRRQAEQTLGEKVFDYRAVTQDSEAAIPREGELVLVPEITGVEFNPRQRSFLWEESVHREEFRFRAAAELAGAVVRGRLTVFLGSIILAEVPLGIRVVSESATRRAPESDSARVYRKIFVSYSRRDEGVVDEITRYARTLGDRYLRDVVDINAGEVWGDRLQSMIREANIFQLFWSWNSVESAFVRQEWEYALALRRPGFVRGVYWEEPMPEVPDRGLPPEELKRLHFQYVAVRGEAMSPRQADKPTPIPDRTSSVEVASGASPSSMRTPPSEDDLKKALEVDLRSLSESRYSWKWSLENSSPLPSASSPVGTSWRPPVRSSSPIGSGGFSGGGGGSDIPAWFLWLNLLNAAAAATLFFAHLARPSLARPRSFI